MQHDDYDSVVADADRRGDDAEMFDLAPVSLWLEDYGELRALFAEWRQRGVADLRAWLRQDPARVAACSRCIRVVKVNRRTLALYEAADLPQLVDNLGRVFRDDMLTAHIEELVQLWDGQPAFFSNTVNYTLGGRAARHPAARPRSCRATRRLGGACWWRSRT